MRALRTGCVRAVAWQWMCDCVAGLAAIHKAGLTHRDIKPENIMLTARGDESARCKHSDMGLALDVTATAKFEIGGRAGTAL